MKNLTICVLALFSVLMFSCKKDKQADTPSTYYIKATKNGISWIGNPYSVFNDQQTKPDTISIGGNKGEEHLAILAKKNSAGNYEVIPDKTKFYVTIGQDAIITDYMLDNTAANTISITKTGSGEIHGTFTLTFKNITSNSSSPAVVTLNQGEFKSALSIAL